MNLATFKRRLQKGTKVHLTNHVKADLTRETVVNLTQTNGLYFDNEGKNSWFEFPKASEYKEVDDNTSEIYFKDRKLFLTVKIL